MAVAVKMSKIHLNFQGYWLDMNLDFIPNQPGVFCVYRCRYSVDTETVIPTELLYIGDAIAARDWIRHHPGRTAWRQILKPHEELCYTFAPMILERKRAASALVARHRPSENFHFASEFELPETEILLSGRIALLRDSFQIGTRVRTVASPHGLKEDQNEAIPLGRKRARHGISVDLEHDDSLELVEALGGA